MGFTRGVDSSQIQKQQFKMPSGIMASHDGATAGTPGYKSQHTHQVLEQQHQRPLPGHLDDAASSSSGSRSSYSRDFSKPTNISASKQTSLLASLNPRNWTRKMRLFAIIGFVLTVVALVPGNYSPLNILKTSQKLILVFFPVFQPSRCRSHCDKQATRAHRTHHLILSTHRPPHLSPTTWISGSCR